MTDEELMRARDEARCDSAVQTLVDVVRRAEEISEGNYTLYDVLGYMVEDLVRDGVCAACLSETMSAVFNDLGVDPTQHVMDEDTVH